MWYRRERRSSSSGESRRSARNRVSGEFYTHSCPRSGFTLIELLVVIAIIATLAAVVAPAIFHHVSDAKTEAAKSQIEIFSLALDSYRLDNDTYPTTEQGLSALPPCRKWALARGTGAGPT